MLDINRQQQIKNSAFSMVGKDRIHPGRRGIWSWPCSFSRAQNVSPFVANISIDARESKLVRAENCKTKEFQASPTQVSFRYDADALPFPIESSAKDALEWTPIINELNQEVLQSPALRREITDCSSMARSGTIPRMSWHAGSISHLKKTPPSIGRRWMSCMHCRRGGGIKSFFCVTSFTADTAMANRPCRDHSPRSRSNANWRNV